MLYIAHNMQGEQQGRLHRGAWSSARERKAVPRPQTKNKMSHKVGQKKRNADRYKETQANGTHAQVMRKPRDKINNYMNITTIQRWQYSTDLCENDTLWLDIFNRFLMNEQIITELHQKS